MLEGIECNWHNLESWERGITTHWLKLLFAVLAYRFSSVTTHTFLYLFFFQEVDVWIFLKINCIPIVRNLMYWNYTIVQIQSSSNTSDVHQLNTLHEILELYVILFCQGLYNAKMLLSSFLLNALLPQVDQYLLYKYKCYFWIVMR